jgi:autotransporter-associated beta strand protein
MLDLNGYTLSAAEPITTNGTGLVAYGAITNNSASATTYPGPITLGATTSRFVNFGAGTLTFGHNIVGSTRALTVVAVGDVEQVSTSVWSGTSSSLTKEGSGVLTLAGQNTITTGTVTVSTGTLRLGANGGATNTPLGTNAAGTTVAAGAVLDLSTFTLGGASTWEPLTLNGSGLNNGGALISSSSGTNTFGVLTLGSAARIINSGSGTITFAGAPTGTFNYVVGGTGPTTFSGIFPAVAITITKYDSGILSLNAANLLTGLVRINAGIIRRITTVKHYMHEHFFRKIILATQL